MRWPKPLDQPGLHQGHHAQHPRGRQPQPQGGAAEVPGPDRNPPNQLQGQYAFSFHFWRFPTEKNLLFVFQYLKDSLQTKPEVSKRLCPEYFVFRRCFNCCIFQEAEETQQLIEDVKYYLLEFDRKQVNIMLSFQKLLSRNPNIFCQVQLKLLRL